MIPKKPKEIIRQLSEEIDVPEDTIDKIVEAYYKEIRKTLSDMQQIKVNVLGIGDFIMRRSIVSASIKNHNKMYARTGTDTFANYHNKKRIGERLEKLTLASKMIEEFIEKRKKFRDERKVHANMGKQSSDTGGDKEQSNQE